MRAWGVDAVEPIVADPGAVREDIHAASGRIRGGERRRTLASPIVVGSLMAIAAIGAALLYFAIQDGALAAGRQDVGGQPDRTAAAPARAS